MRKQKGEKVEMAEMLKYRFPIDVPAALYFFGDTQQPYIS